MNKTKLTTEDLSKAIQFMKDHSIGSDEISLDRLIGWIKYPLNKRRGTRIMETKFHEDSLNE